MVNHLQVQREQPLGLMGFNICHARLRGCFLVIWWHLFVLYSQSPSWARFASYSTVTLWIVALGDQRRQENFVELLDGRFKFNRRCGSVVGWWMRFTMIYTWFMRIYVKHLESRIHLPVCGVPMSVRDACPVASPGVFWASILRGFVAPLCFEDQVPICCPLAQQPASNREMSHFSPLFSKHRYVGPRCFWIVAIMKTNHKISCHLALTCILFQLIHCDRLLRDRHQKSSRCQPIYWIYNVYCIPMCAQNPEWSRMLKHYWVYRLMKYIVTTNKYMHPLFILFWCVWVCK